MPCRLPASRDARRQRIAVARQATVRQPVFEETPLDTLARLGETLRGRTHLWGRGQAAEGQAQESKYDEETPETHDKASRESNQPVG